MSLLGLIRSLSLQLSTSVIDTCAQLPALLQANWRFFPRTCLHLSLLTFTHSTRALFRHSQHHASMIPTVCNDKYENHYLLTSVVSEVCIGQFSVFPSMLKFLILTFRRSLSRKCGKSHYLSPLPQSWKAMEDVAWKKTVGKSWLSSWSISAPEVCLWRLCMVFVLS